MEIKYKREDELQEGDCIVMLGTCRIIAGFREYTGPIDFVARIAVFTDGSSMSLEKGHPYRTTSFWRKSGIFK